MTGDPEWLTIAEAAARLGVGERHARRCVALLPAGERSEPGVRPAKVHWTRQNAFLMSGKVSDLNDLTDIAASEVEQYSADQPPAGADLPPIGAETVSETLSECPADVRTESEPALIEQLRSEVAYLRAELTATREAAEIAASENRRLLLASMPPEPAALAEAPPAPQPERRRWIARLMRWVKFG